MIKYFEIPEKATSSGFAFGLWLLLLSFFASGFGEGTSILLDISASPVLPSFLFSGFDYFGILRGRWQVLSLSGFLFPPIVWAVIFRKNFAIKKTKKWKYGGGVLFLTIHYCGVIIALIFYNSGEWHRFFLMCQDYPPVVFLFFSSYLIVNIFLIILVVRRKGRPFGKQAGRFWGS